MPRDVKVRTLQRHYDKLAGRYRGKGEIYEIPVDSARRRADKELVAVIEDQQFTGPDENQQMSPVEETKEETGVGVVPDEENLGREYPEEMPEAQNAELTEDDLPEGYVLEGESTPEDGPIYQIIGPDGSEVQGPDGSIAWGRVSNAVRAALQVVEEEFDPWDYIEQRGNSPWYDVEDYEENPVNGKQNAIDIAEELHG